ncbi:MAG: aminodeoxychorismate/anthranilate synthase component II [Saprospiraceae bacterium]|nr:aminodeoxychorismate/anthranilate synthase component II [Saprospiraceae bacterium]
MKILLLDNYDSFTFNLYDYLLQTGADCVVCRNDTFETEALNDLDFQAIVLSPGPKRPADAGRMMEVVQTFSGRLPMLGICLGHQAIGEYFGAKLIKAAVPVHGKTSMVEHRGHWMFDGIPNPFEAMRYHSLILESLAETPLRSIAETEKGEIMALEHPSLPIIGVQFHPESILTRNGFQIIRNWVNHLS